MHSSFFQRCVIVGLWILPCGGSGVSEMYYYYDGYGYYYHYVPYGGGLLFICKDKSNEIRRYE
uniref:CX domain-containing protein n=1 Tax=Elaeophora elaphi TaxID=1147741 RepID=A0A0R3RRX6_9BILA